MTSDLFPSPHTCSVCERLTLYRRDQKWWEAAIESSSKDSDGFDGILGIRVKQWLIGQLRDKATAGEKSEPAEFRLRNHSSSLWSLHDIVIFDFTIAEAREAAKECSLCFSIIGDHLIGSKESKFLAAYVSEFWMYFGPIEIELEPDESVFKNPDKKFFRVGLLGTHLDFELMALPDNNASKEVSTRPVNTRPKSDDNLRLARTWLQTCLETHEACPKPKGNFMPSRIMEIMQVRGRRYLRLVDTNLSPPEPYIALSYCWGGKQRVKTTSETNLHHRTGINIQSLPDTVRDAVLVAESLGILKIWIDAFCIIQDDQQDKAWEIAQMPLIYSQATVTITASRASRVHDGFLKNRSRMAEDTPNLVFQLPFRCSNNQVGSVVFLPRVRQSTEPLDMRAWALQERFLSPRILEYGTLQTRWICQNTDGSEFPTDGYKASNVYNKERSDRLFIAALKGVLVAANSDFLSLNQSDDLRNHWYGLVNVYTNRALSLDSDRLLAISGIAAQFGRFLRDEYKAGLWKSKMWSELLWRVDGISRNLRARPKEYQAPSWSWAAVNDPVMLVRVLDQRSHVDILDCQIDFQAANANFLVYDASFGAVKAGSLIVKGRLQPAEWTCEHVLRKREIEGLEGMIPTCVYPDALEAEFAGGNTISIPVFLLKVAGPEIKGLILRQQSDSEFSRLGVFEFQQRFLGRFVKDWGLWEERHFQRYLDWLDESPMQTITIV